MDKGAVWIGTSGWVYKQWAGNFYPKGWPKKNEFGYYVRHFPTVEINATFYRLPSLKMVRGWHEKAPKGFIFAVKGSRYLTHIKRLRDTGRGLRKYFRRLVPLGDRTGPILWQLPPNFAKDDETVARLERFLLKLPKQYQHAIEFRHPSWMDEHTFALLRRHHVANVWLSSLRMPAEFTITGGFVYLRFHGLEGGAYHDYSDDELRPWAEQLVRAARRGIPSYVYFNNDLNTRAPLNAAAIMRLVARVAVPAKALEGDAELPDIHPPRGTEETWPAWSRRASVRSAERRHQTNAAGTRRNRASAPAPRDGRRNAITPAVTGAAARRPVTAARRRK